MSDQTDSPDENDMAENATNDDAAGNGAVDVSAVVAALEAENANLKDRILRAAAEMENLRKRTQREVSDARSYAISDFARDMLTATDNLERALKALSDDARANATPDMAALIEGIEMTEREMQRLLQKNGVKPILAEGEKFNPHKHQAMFEVPDPSVPEGTVVSVMQSGFEIGERVLRPAMVGVSKGGAKAPKVAPETDANNVTDAAAAEEVEQTQHVDKQV
ncbi:MAG: nucleotide exchange factor GrpE [Hyphomicrobiaceae bacterium]|nr:nucleotide exchange factor GrpE [Hyphomicrobiaceae bacterium]MCC0024043.1 nucleotide exchange factor GrpE [Hyphomicrobiaceae bacterium]